MLKVLRYSTTTTTAEAGTNTVKGRSDKGVFTVNKETSFFFFCVWYIYIEGSLSTNVQCVCTDAEPMSCKYFAKSTLVNTIARNNTRWYKGVSFSMIQYRRHNTTKLYLESVRYWNSDQNYFRLHWRIISLPIENKSIKNYTF